MIFKSMSDMSASGKKLFLRLRNHGWSGCLARITYGHFYKLSALYEFRESHHGARADFHLLYWHRATVISRLRIVFHNIRRSMRCLRERYEIHHPLCARDGDSRNLGDAKPAIRSMCIFPGRFIIGIPNSAPIIEDHSRHLSASRRVSDASRKVRLIAWVRHPSCLCIDRFGMVLTIADRGRVRVSFIVGQGYLIGRLLLGNGNEVTSEPYEVWH